jgi:hypothetical protein
MAVRRSLVVSKEPLAAQPRRMLLPLLQQQQLLLLRRVLISPPNSRRPQRAMLLRLWLPMPLVPFPKRHLVQHYVVVLLRPLQELFLKPRLTRLRRVVLRVLRLLL